MVLNAMAYARILSIFPKGVPRTPAEIDRLMDVRKHKNGGIGQYASHHICILKRVGFEFEAKREGKRVVSYTLTKEPANAKELRRGTIDVSTLTMTPLGKPRGARGKNPISARSKPLMETLELADVEKVMAEAKATRAAKKAANAKAKEAQKADDDLKMAALREIIDVASEVRTERVRSVLTASRLKELQAVKARVGITEET